MSDLTLSPPSIIKLLRFRWVSKSKRASSQTVSMGSSEVEPHTEKAESSTESGSQPKENLEVATLTHLDSMPEIDSAHAKCSKGILKDPKNSIVIKVVKAKCGSMDSDNLDGSKIKKVTFSADTKKAEIRRNRRRAAKKIVLDNQKVETSSANNFMPMTRFETYSSPRNVFKISTTHKSDQNPRCAFNINIPAKQSNDIEDNRKNLLKVPSFEKNFDLEFPVRPCPSLHTMLEESPIYPSEVTKTIPVSARNTTTKASWNVHLHDGEVSISLTPRDGQKRPRRDQREKDMDYFAELQRKAPLVLANTPSRPHSKTGSRPLSKSGSQENIFVISRKDFTQPVVIPHERHEVRTQKAFA